MSPPNSANNHRNRTPSMQRDHIHENQEPTTRTYWYLCLMDLIFGNFKYDTNTYLKNNLTKMKEDRYPSRFLQFAFIVVLLFDAVGIWTYVWIVTLHVFEQLLLVYIFIFVIFFFKLAYFCKFVIYYMHVPTGALFIWKYMPHTLLVLIISKVFTIYSLLRRSL